MNRTDLQLVRRGNLFTLTLVAPLSESGIRSVDYEDLYNKPKINGVELVGELTSEDLGIGETAGMEPLTNYELDLITGSASTEEAFLALLSNGGEVMLGSNITLSDTITITTDTTLDLNGYVLTGTTSFMFIVDNAKLTLLNGHISSNGCIARAQKKGTITVKSGTYRSSDIGFVVNNATLAFNGGELTSVESSIEAYSKATIEINGGSIASEDKYALFTDGQGENAIVINGGEIIGHTMTAGHEACGVYVASNDKVTMNGGKILANGGCGLLMRNGRIVINNGEITALNGDNVPGPIGDDSTVLTASAIIYQETTYPNMFLIINNGMFTGFNKSIDVISSKPNITINGGRFNPWYQFKSN